MSSLAGTVKRITESPKFKTESNSQNMLKYNKNFTLFLKSNLIFKLMADSLNLKIWKQ